MPNIKRQQVFNYFLTNKGTAVDAANALNAEYAAVYYHVRMLVEDGQLYRSEKKRGQDGFTYSTVKSPGYTGSPKLYKVGDNKYEFQDAMMHYWERHSNWKYSMGSVNMALASLLVRARFPELRSRDTTDEMNHIHDFKEATQTLLKLLDAMLTSGLISDPQNFMNTVGEVNWGYIFWLNEMYAPIKHERVTPITLLDDARKEINTEYAPDPEVEVIP